jgi:hypothetical protein
MRLALGRVLYNPLEFASWTVRDSGSETDRADVHILARQPFPSFDSGGRHRNFFLHGKYKGWL